MTEAEIEVSVEGFWLAQQWQPDPIGAMFDHIAARLHRDPRFRGLSLCEIDLVLADARVEVEEEFAVLALRLSHDLRDAIHYVDQQRALALMDEGAA
jgi:hypothetical protein